MSAVPVVFIHGFPLSKHSWDAQSAAVSVTRRAVAYDLRGFGQSPIGGVRVSMDVFADDLIALLDREKIERAVVCGLSMGGYIALNAIGRYPKRFAGLILCDTKSQADSAEAKAKRAATILTVKKEGVGPFADAFLTGVLRPETFKEHPAIVEAAKRIIMGNTSEGICAALQAMAERADTTEVLSKISVPSLVMVGENDTLTPPAAAESMAAAIRGAQLEIIPKAGHLSNLENPVEFNRRLTGWVQTNF